MRAFCQYFGRGIAVFLVAILASCYTGAAAETDIPIAVELKEGCARFTGTYSVTGEAYGEDFAPDDSAYIYDVVFGSVELPKDAKTFYVEPFYDGIETEVRFISKDGSVLQVNRYTFDWKCERTWWSYSRKSSGGGGADLSYAYDNENIVRVALARDGSLIVHKTSITVWKKFFFFKSKVTNDSWYRFISVADSLDRHNQK